MNLQSIIKRSGLKISNIQRVSGGDINDAYCLAGDSKKYFLKVNNASRYPRMFAKEAQGLQALQKGCDLVVPAVTEFGEAENHQYLILEWIEKSRPHKNFWEEFGTSLASMHRQPQQYFGFTEDNYIGSLVQNNSVHESWSSFYTECRIMPLVKQLKDNGSFSIKDINTAELFCNKLDDIFPAETPSLLHGDLWSGNYMAAQNGRASIYDPAVYYGHREMDLGMTLLFGGFSAPFYEHYNEAYPLEKNWRKRVRYTQLYPLLVHAILFGGHYVHSVREILKEF